MVGWAVVWVDQCPFLYVGVSCSPGPMVGYPFPACRWVDAKIASLRAATVAKNPRHGRAGVAGGQYGAVSIIEQIGFVA